LLRDPVAAVRIEAARAATRLQRVTRSVVSGLAEQLAAAQAAVRREAAAAVAGLGRQMATRAILNGLVPLLEEEDMDIAREAARAACALAERMTPELRRGLIRQMRSSNAAVRSACVRAIGAAGRRAGLPEVVQEVVHCFVDSEAEVRREAVLAYGSICPEADEPPTEALVKLLGDADGMVQQAAAELVGRLGRRVLCSSMIDAVGRLLLPDAVNPTGLERQQNSFRRETVSRAALLAAERFGPPAATSSIIEGTLAWILGGDREACRTAEALGAVDDVVARLAGMLRSPDRKARDRCIGALVVVREAACWPALLDELLALLRAPEGTVRASAAYALEWLGPKAATTAIVARLQELVDDSDGDVRFHVADALARLHPFPA
jgi:HEAT repeat protein